MKRVAVALGVLLAACGSKAPPSDRHPMRGTDRVPLVDSVTVVAADVITAPPLLVIVDANGTFYLAAADTWDDLTTTDPLATARHGQAAAVAFAVTDAFTGKLSPRQVVEEFSDNEPPEPPSSPASEDPPPPELEKPDDGAEESGGTGTMVTLDEGKMGRKDGPDRRDREPEVVTLDVSRGSFHVELGGGRAPGHLSVVAGQIAPDGRVAPRQRALVLAHPSSSANAVIKAVEQTEGLIAVHFDGRVRPLRIEFLGDTPDWADPWIEVRVGSQDLLVEAIPSEPIMLATYGASDSDYANKLAHALSTVRDTAELYGGDPIDVLVESDVSAQRLIDVLVALDIAGERSINLGYAPETGSAQALARGRREPRLMIGQPYAQGDLPKAMIRKVIKRHSQELLTCFKRRLLDIPWLQGTIQTQFFITPNGTVATASANGVHPAVADCFAAVIKTIEFPKPRGGGGVQVNYPFALRP